MVQRMTHAYGRLTAARLEHLVVLTYGTHAHNAQRFPLQLSAQGQPDASLPEYLLLLIHPPGEHEDCGQSPFCSTGGIHTCTISMVSRN